MPSGGGSARGAVRYVLGYELGAKGEADRESFHALQAEAMDRDDGGAGMIWSPTTGDRTRPSSVYAKGVTSVVTAGVEMEGIASKNVRVKEPVQHFVFSFNERESATLTDEQIIRAAESTLDGMGLGDHQSVFAVHRDTVRFEMVDDVKTTVPGSGNVHVHVAVATVNPYTLKAWERSRNHYRMSWELRKTEAAMGLEHDRGAAVWDEGLGAVRWAETAEKAAWRRDDVEQRLEDLARKSVGDYAGFESDQSWAERVATAVGGRLRESQVRGEPLSAADIHSVAAGLSARVRALPGAKFEVMLLDRVPKGEIESERARIVAADPDLAAREAHGERVRVRVPTQRVRTTVVLDVDAAAGRTTIGPGATTFEGLEEEARRARAVFVSELEDAEAAERTFADAVRSDPAMISRGIVAGGRATFTTDDIFDEISKRVSDHEVLYELQQTVERDDATLHVLSADTSQPLYTTKDHLALERRVEAKLERLASERDPKFDKRALERAIRDIEAEKTVEWRAQGKTDIFRLSTEQLALVRGVEYRFTIAQGDAGTGKTTAMEVIARYGEYTGRDVVGFTTSEAAAKKLASEAKISTANTSRAHVLEQQGDRIITQGSAAIFDETSMLDLDALDRGTDLVIERESIMVMIGDSAQLQNIGAGATHDIAKDVGERHGRLTHLTEVRRQRGELAWMKAVVPRMGAAIQARDADALCAQIAEIDARDVFKFSDTREDAVRAGAGDYVAAVRRGESALLIAGDRMTCGHLNDIVRENLGMTGNGVKFDTAEYGAREFAVGDKIVFLRNNRKLGRVGVDNGDVGTVERIDFNEKKSRWTLAVRRDGDGALVAFDPKRYDAISHGYAMTVHKAEGQSIQTVVGVGDRGMSAELLHTALTRAESNLAFHVSSETYEDADAISEAVSRRMGSKDSAVLFERVVEKTGGPDTAWACRTRAAMDDANDPLRREHAADNKARDKAFGERAREIAKKYREKGRALSADASPKERRALERAMQSETKAAREELRPRSFTEYALSKKDVIERRVSARAEISTQRERAHVRERVRDLENTREKERGISR